jgi:hypothetical protein
MVPECFDRYDFDYIDLESFEFRGPRSGSRIDHALWTLRDLFPYVSWYKSRRPHLPFSHNFCLRVRRQAGLGSLGQERFVAIAKWQGGCIAREAKLTVPSACSWLSDRSGHRQSWYEKAISSAVRSPDPFQVIDGSWLIRRLSPDSNPIDIQMLPKHSDEEMLLTAMGNEAANVHLGTQNQTKKILKDLKMRKRDWLMDAAEHMAKLLEKDWKRYRKS